MVTQSVDIKKNFGMISIFGNRFLFLEIDFVIKRFLKIDLEKTIFGNRFRNDF